MAAIKCNVYVTSVFSLPGAELAVGRGRRGRKEEDGMACLNWRSNDWLICILMNFADSRTTLSLGILVIIGTATVYLPLLAMGKEGEEEVRPLRARKGKGSVVFKLGGGVATGGWGGSSRERWKRRGQGMRSKGG